MKKCKGCDQRTKAMIALKNQYLERMKGLYDKTKVKIADALNKDKITIRQPIELEAAYISDEEYDAWLNDNNEWLAKKALMTEEELYEYDVEYYKQRHNREEQ